MKQIFKWSEVSYENSLNFSEMLSEEVNEFPPLKWISKRKWMLCVRISLSSATWSIPTGAYLRWVLWEFSDFQKLLRNEIQIQISFEIQIGSLLSVCLIPSIPSILRSVFFNHRSTFQETHDQSRAPKHSKKITASETNATICWARPLNWLLFF